MEIDEAEKLFTIESDLIKRKELFNLFSDWKEVIRHSKRIKFRDDKKNYNAIDYFNSDGFLPGYFSSSTKIVFIGRESRYSSGNDRVKSDIDGLTTNFSASSSYWRRILYLAYGIKNEGNFEFSSLPTAGEILKEMIKMNNFNFALMNISKYSNDSRSGANADFSLINQFLNDSKLTERNFIEEEIILLDPEIIITANLWSGKISKQELNLVFPENSFKFINEFTDKAVLFNYKLGNKIVKLIDLYHFSARGNDQELFYDPVMSLLFH